MGKPVTAKSYVLGACIASLELRVATFRTMQVSVVFLLTQGLTFQIQWGVFRKDFALGGTATTFIETFILHAMHS